MAISSHIDDARDLIDDRTLERFTYEMPSKSLKTLIATIVVMSLALGGLIYKYRPHRDAANVILIPSSEGVESSPATTSATKVNIINSRKSITDADLSQIPYRIPITLNSTSTDYKIGDTVKASYDFPVDISNFKRNDGTCVSASTNNQLITEPYILDDNSGVLFGFHSNDFSTEKGMHSLNWETSKLLRQFALTTLETETPSGWYRIVIISRKPCMKQGAAPVMDGGIESVDDLFSNVATGKVLGIGYSASFVLRSAAHAFKGKI